MGAQVQMTQASIINCSCPGSGHGFCGFGNAGLAAVGNLWDQTSTFKPFFRATNSVRDAFELLDTQDGWQAHPSHLVPTPQTFEDCTSANYVGGLYLAINDASLVDSHIRRCRGGANGGGLWVTGGGTVSVIRGSITGCSAGIGGAAVVSYSSTLSLIDVLVADCHAEGDGGGGIDVELGSLTMRGGTIRNCQAPDGYGGGIRAATLLQLSGVVVQGCSASFGGGVHLKEGADAQLVDVAIENCKALAGLKASAPAWNLGGGGISASMGSTLNANRVHIARCHSGNDLRGQAGGAASLLGTSSWIDSTFSDCTSSRYGTVYVTEGTQTFTRVAFVRCQAIGDLSIEPYGGALAVDTGAGTAILLDSRIVDSGTRKSRVGAPAGGGCIHVRAEMGTASWSCAT